MGGERWQRLGQGFGTGGLGLKGSKLARPSEPASSSVRRGQWVVSNLRGLLPALETNVSKVLRMCLCILGSSCNPNTQQELSIITSLLPLKETLPLSHLWDTRAQPPAEGGSWFQHPEDTLPTLAHHVPPLPESPCLPPAPAPCPAPWPNWNNRPCSGRLCFLTLTSPAPQSVSSPDSKGLKNLPPILATILPILPEPHSYPDGWYPGFQSPDLPLCPCPPSPHAPW